MKVYLVEYLLDNKSKISGIYTDYDNAIASIMDVVGNDFLITELEANKNYGGNLGLLPHWHLN